MFARALQSAGARRYWVIWVAVVPIVLWAIVRAFGLESGSMLTALMWLTPYASAAALLVVGVAVALRNWAAAVIAALAATSLALAVLPRAIGSDVEQPAGRQTLTVLSSNVYLGTASAADLVALVDRYSPDMLSVQELTPSFAARLQRAGLGRRFPHAVLMPQPRGRGGGLYSRYPLARLSHQTHFRFRMPRAILTLPGGRRLRVISVHPMPPNMSYDEWKRGLSSLPNAGSGIPWVLAGDFNGTFDQAEFRDVADSGYRDAADATGKGLQPTWPTDEVFPWGVMTIDHVLADRRLGVADFGVVSLEGSDHRAVHAQLVLP